MAYNDSALLAIVSAGPCPSYQAVIERLRALEAQLDRSDGLLWFTRVYAAMTDAVIAAASAHRFSDARFVERLDCQFADLYFAALAAHLTDPGSGPGAWQPLLRARNDSRVSAVQLAVAGVNAHINRDLAVALVNTFQELGAEPDRDSALYRDYLEINAILSTALGDVKAWLLPDDLQALDTALGQLDDLLELWSLVRARDAAWVAGEVRWALRGLPLLARHHLDALDRMVGLAGRALLLPLAHPARGRAALVLPAESQDAPGGVNCRTHPVD